MKISGIRWICWRYASGLQRWRPKQSMPWLRKNRPSVGARLDAIIAASMTKPASWETHEHGTQPTSTAFKSLELIYIPLSKRESNHGR